MTNGRGRRSVARARRARARQRGFTLLEVLVAVGILGLSLTVILSAQVGLFSSQTRVENLTVSTNLARCRMNELEEELLREGFSLLDESEEGPCCNDEITPRMRCAWKVETIELPEPTDLESIMGGDSLLGGGGDLGNMGPLGAMQQIQQQGSAALGDKPDLSALAGLMTEASAGGTGAIAPLVMGFVYPQIKPMLEASIRKVTVTVTWKEGSRVRDLEVEQYLTRPQQGGFDPNAAKEVNEALDQVLPGGVLPGVSP